MCVDAQVPWSLRAILSTSSAVWRSESRPPTGVSQHVHPDLTRREAVAVLASGFALAVRPVTAETITTDATGLVAGEVRILTPDGGIPAYRAQPASGGPFPIIRVVQEIFGGHKQIKDICRRFAKLGYLAVAPELYFRQDDVSQITDFKEILTTVVSKVPDAQVLSDLDAT